MSGQYYIRDEFVFGPHGYTGYRIQGDYIYGPQGYTYFFVLKDHIIGPNGTPDAGSRSAIYLARWSTYPGASRLDSPSTLTAQGNQLIEMSGSSRGREV